MMWPWLAWSPAPTVMSHDQIIITFFPVWATYSIWQCTLLCLSVGQLDRTLEVWQQLLQQVSAQINFETAPRLCRHLENPVQTLEAMLRPKVATLPGHIQAVYVQNAAKLFATVLKSQEGNTENTAAQETSQLMIDRLPLFVQSANLEVQERVKCLLIYIFLILLKYISSVIC